MFKISKVLRSLIFDWPGSMLHKILAGLAKVALGLLAVVGGAILLVLGLPLLLLALALFLALVLAVIGAVNVLVGGFREDDAVEDPAAMPVASCEDVNVVSLLGPFNSQPAFRRYDAVFEGGGVKAIAQIGALACFDQLGLRPRRVIGTSGGAIVAAFLAAGATPAQMWKLLAATDLTQFIDPRWLPNQRWLRRPLYGLMPLASGVLLRKAAVRGRRFQEVIESNLHNVIGIENLTFADIKARTGVELEIVATDITRRKALVLPEDVKDFEGWAEETARDFPVAKAVRMSMALPFIFEPVRLNLTDGGTPVDIVDGGVSSNYPIWRFDTNSRAGPACPTFGFLLDETIDQEAIRAKPVRYVLDYAFNIVQSGIGAIDRIQNCHNEARTIRLPTYRVGTTEFDLTPEMQQRLFDGGFERASEKLHSFEWAEYVHDFRGGRARVPHGAEVPPEFAGQPSFELDGVTYSVA